MADAPDLGSGEETHGGSNPLARTKPLSWRVTRSRQPLELVDTMQEDRLKTTMELLEGNEYKVVVTIPAKDVDRAVAEEYKEMSKQAKIKGFRKGKVPRSVLDANVGAEKIRAQAGDRIVNESFPEAIEQLGLIPAAMPQAAALKPIVDGEDYEYSGEIEIRPQMTLTSIDDIKVRVEVPVPEEREVDAQVEFLRDQHATLEVVEDRGIETGDFVLLSFTGYVDDEPYEENEVDGLLYELGAGDMPTEFDEALLGARAGDEVVAQFVVPMTSLEADLIGKTAKFVVNVTEVKRKVLPAVDDDFAANVSGLESLDALKDDIRTNLVKAKETARKRSIEAQARAALADRVEQSEMPTDMVQSREKEMYSDFRENLKGRNMTEADYMRGTGLTLEEINADFSANATQRVREELALEALFRLQGLELGKDELEEEIKRMADAYDMKVDELRTDLRNRFITPIVRLQLVFQHATEWLLDHVEVIDIEPEAPSAAAVDPATPQDKPARKSRARSAGTKSKAKKAADTADKKKDEGEAEA